MIQKSTRAFGRPPSTEAKLLYFRFLSSFTDVDFSSTLPYSLWNPQLIQKNVSKILAVSQPLLKILTRISTLTSEPHLFIPSLPKIGDIPYMPALIRPIPTPAVHQERWIRKVLEERLQTHPGQADIFSHILAGSKNSGKKLSFGELQADAGLLVVAGADTR